ncbi:MAG: phage baseplate assembly protein V [Aquabacterium sp.]
MNELLHAMRLQAQIAMSGGGASRLATVASFNPDNYTVKVVIQPEGVESGWLPLASAWVGNGWGMFCPPMPGDMVQVDFMEDSPDAGVVTVRLFNDQDRPLRCPAGELWLVHQSGAFFKLTNDGAATFSDGQGATVQLKGGNITSQASNWTHTGPMTIDGVTTIRQRLIGQGGMAISGGTGGAAATISGNLQVSGGDVTADAIGLKTHRHTGVQGGTGTSGGPTP